MFIIINKNRVIVDYSNTIQYLKLIPTTNLYIFSDIIDEAQLVKSPRTNTTYFLSQVYPVHDSVSIKEIEDSQKDNIVCGYSKYLIKDEHFVIETNIQQIQQDKQEENKQKFNEYLNAHPVTFNNKQYGTTLEDQLEIALVLSQASAAVSGTDESLKVEWHAKNEANEEMSIEDLLALQVKIKEAVDAPYKKMQEYKVAIFDCTDAKTLVEMSFEYEGGKNA